MLRTFKWNLLSACIETWLWGRCNFDRLQIPVTSESLGIFKEVFKFSFKVPKLQASMYRRRAGCRAKIAQKNLLYKNVLMILSKILPLVFTDFLICLRVKQLLIGIQLIKEYKSIINGLIKKISDKTSYKLHLTKILKKRLFGHYPITSK